MTCRRGTVIAAALALMLLAAGLLASAAIVASSRAESAARARLALVAEAGSHRVLARLLAENDPGIDALPVGGALTRTVALDVNDRSADLPLAALVRVQRLSSSTWILAVDLRAGTGVTARRRLAVIVRRSGAPDAPLAGALAPIARWSTADLY